MASVYITSYANLEFTQTAKSVQVPKYSLQLDLFTLPPTTEFLGG